MPLPTDPVVLPWSTGFEEGFCDYTRFTGYCYGDRPYVLVTEPHHSGRFAAEFTAIDTEADAGAGPTGPTERPENQTRCVRQGVLPESAYYGAWYFIAEPLKKRNRDGLWNLFHFQGLDNPDRGLALWDVTLVEGQQDGDWELVVYDPLGPLNNNTYRSADHRRVPIGSWFHIELFLKRAADATGEIRLYQASDGQDSVLLFEKTGLRSDLSKYTQWYVGDWAGDVTPDTSRLYVDDVSIRATRSPVSATQ